VTADAAYHVIARLLAGVPVNDAEIEALPERDRQIGRRLVGANGNGPELFKQAIDELILDVGQRQKFYTAVMNVDPAAPAQKKPQRFVVYSAKDALQPQGDIAWIVERLVSRGSVNTLVGKSGSKKTYVCLDMGVRVSLKKPWLGLATNGGPVLIVDEESGQHRLGRRLGAVLAGHGADETTPIFYTCLSQLNLRELADVQALEDLIIEYGAVLVFIDTMADIMPGADENAVKDVQPVFMNLRGIAERTQAGIVIVHHLGKAGDYRGSTAISGAVDLMLIVESQPDSMVINFSFDKARDVEPFKFSATANFEPGKFWLDGRELQTTGPKLGKAQRYVLRYLNAHGAAPIEDIMAGADTCAPQGARQAVYALADMGLAQRINAGERGESAVYELTVKGKLTAEGAG
jgi:hypothetical protein